MFEWLVDRYWRWKHDWHHRRLLPWERTARSLGFYPAYADWSGGIALDRAGEVWRSEDTSWGEPTRVFEAEIRFAAQGIALRRYPSWRRLCPKEVPRIQTARRVMV